LVALSMRRSFSSVADPDGADVPAVAVPEALLLPVAAGGRGRSAFVIDRPAIGRAAGGDGSADDCTTDQAGRYAGGNAALGVRRRRTQRAGDRCDREEGSKGLLHSGTLLEMAHLGAGFRGTLNAHLRIGSSR